jgi:hypothetical protein
MSMKVSLNAPTLELAWQLGRESVGRGALVWEPKEGRSMWLSVLAVALI